MHCNRCGQNIEGFPCPNCGSESNTTTIPASGPIETNISFFDKIRAPSSVHIESMDKKLSLDFPAGSTSAQIVTSSLSQIGIEKQTPKYISEQLISNIRGIEKWSVASSATDINTGVEDKHSFTINLGFIKYTYTRKIKY